MLQVKNKGMVNELQSRVEQLDNLETSRQSSCIPKSNPIKNSEAYFLISKGIHKVILPYSSLAIIRQIMHIPKKIKIKLVIIISCREITTISKVIMTHDNSVIIASETIMVRKLT